MATGKKKGISLRIRFDFPETFTNEPLVKLLKSIKWINPLSVFVIMFFVGIVDDLLVGAYLGYWHSSPNTVGVFDVNNIPALIMSLIVEPGMWAFFVGFPKALRDLITMIEAKNIILSEEQFVKDQVAWLKSPSSSRWLMVAALPMTGLISFYSLLIIGEYRPTPWFYLDGHYWVLLLRVVFTAYVTVYSVLWSLLALSTLSSVFSRAKIKVNAYDSDNAGGLLFIGRFILMVSRLVLIVVPFLVAETLFAIRLGRGIVGQFNLWMEIIILPVLLTFMIFLPLSACRQAMFAAKEEFLAPLRDKILAHVNQIFPHGPISRPELGEVTALIEFQTKLRKDFPLWPFDISMSQQLGVSFLLTLLPIIFNIIIQLAK